MIVSIEGTPSCCRGLTKHVRWAAVLPQSTVSMSTSVSSLVDGVRHALDSLKLAKQRADHETQRPVLVTNLMHTPSPVGEEDRAFCHDFVLRHLGVMLSAMNTTMTDVVFVHVAFDVAGAYERQIADHDAITSSAIVTYDEFVRDACEVSIPALAADVDIAVEAAKISSKIKAAWISERSTRPASA
jgi:hypothetical protein